MVIDKGVPIPDSCAHGNGKHPFKNMDVGDSVFVPGASRSGRETNAAASYGRSKGWSFRWAPVDCGVRIWRTK